MSGRLAGKTCFVTAAGQGIGRATALAFAHDGARVIATDIDGPALEALADAQPGIETERLDVRDSAAVSSAADRHREVDVLFNCAGFVHHGSILDVGDDDYDFSFDLNVRSAFQLSRAFLPAMLDARVSVEEMGERIFDLILRTASGKETCSEALDFGENEFVPWQIGAVM